MYGLELEAVPTAQVSPKGIPEHCPTARRGSHATPGLQFSRWSIAPRAKTNRHGATSGLAEGHGLLDATLRQNCLFCRARTLGQAPLATMIAGIRQLLVAQA